MESSFPTMNRLFEARRIIGRDVAAGFVAIAHKIVASTGIMVLTVIVLGIVRPEMRETMLAALTEMRTELASTTVVADMAARGDALASAATAARTEGSALHVLPHRGGPGATSREQIAATNFLVRKYRLAPDAMALVVAEAFDAGNELKIDPLLILAVMSIESSMNPFAQSNVGAQGLMQVMTTVHAERFEAFGGPRAALNPVANIRVGAGILKELIDRNGSVEAGLKAYVGAALLDDDGGYGLRVLLERARLEAAVARGARSLPALDQRARDDDNKSIAVPVSFSPASKGDAVKGVNESRAQGAAASPRGDDRA